jgi:superfamily II DNA/RNA helicase
MRYSGLELDRKFVIMLMVFLPSVEVHGRDRHIADSKTLIEGVWMQIMAFFVTANITRFYAELFNALGQPVLEMHSRKSQSARTRIAEQFRHGSQLIMFSSDVSARGVDYPDVSLVIQVRTPSPYDPKCS